MLFQDLDGFRGSCAKPGHELCLLLFRVVLYNVFICIYIYESILLTLQKFHVTLHTPGPVIYTLFACSGTESVCVPVARSSRGRTGFARGRAVCGGRIIVNAPWQHRSAGERKMPPADLFPQIFALVFNWLSGEMHGPHPSLPDVYTLVMFRSNPTRRGT